jgi:hypothetical protein
MGATPRTVMGIALLLASGFSCSDESESDRMGIASVCTQDKDCEKVGDVQLTCLTAFKGGYCGLAGCAQDSDCPTGAACIAEAGVNYCFRECIDKPECNLHRTVDAEANCVGSAVHVGVSSAKVCVPPSGS